MLFSRDFFVSVVVSHPYSKLPTQASESPTKDNQGSRSILLLPAVGTNRMECSHQGQQCARTNPTSFLHRRPRLVRLFFSGEHATTVVVTVDPVKLFPQGGSIESAVLPATLPSPLPPPSIQTSLPSWDVCSKPAVSSISTNPPSSAAVASTP
jgi:hypothetical protein